MTRKHLAVFSVVAASFIAFLAWGQVRTDAVPRRLLSAFVLNPKVVTIADNVADGGTITATLTLTPTDSSHIALSCADTDGCDITMGETGVRDGTVVYITNTSSNACNFADTSGVSELSGTFAMGQYDSLSLIYAVDRWIELDESNN